MILSPAGIIVTCLIALCGGFLGSSMIVGLLISIAFGATAIGALPMLGGSSPQVFTVFAMALIIMSILHPGSARYLLHILRRHWTIPAMLLLGMYAAAGAFALPRLFAGEASAFIPVAGRIYEAPLSPVSGNISQTLYFLIGVLSFVGMTAWLCRTGEWRIMKIALLAFAATNGALGLVDILAKLSGITDVLAPVRTANYALLTTAIEASFWRISGGHSEASAFAQAALSAWGVAFCYWRATGSKIALASACLNGLLILFSTSSTAYMAMFVLTAAGAMHLAARIASGRIPLRDARVAGAVAIGMFTVILAWVATPQFFEPILNLIDNMLLRKTSSASGVERAYWNIQGLSAVTATWGLGIGFGSSRASSWIVATISQLGIPGAIAISVIIVALAREAGLAERAASKSALKERVGLAAAARGGALASILGSSISGASADPGILVFLCLAIIVAMRVSQTATDDRNGMRRVPSVRFRFRPA